MITAIDGSPLGTYVKNLGKVPRCGKKFYTTTHTYTCVAIGPHGVHFDQPEDEPIKEWVYNGTGRIIRNRVACMGCGEVIESIDRHHFVMCSCKSTHVDGGHDYCKRGFKPEVGFVDMTLWEPRRLPSADGDRAKALGWLEFKPSCGSCGEFFQRKVSSKDGRFDYLHHAPECDKCFEARVEAQQFLKLHLQVLRVGAVPGEAPCPYRSFCTINLKGEEGGCPHTVGGGDIPCNRARLYSAYFPKG